MMEKMWDDEFGKEFICGIKSNRLAALSSEDKRQGKYERIESMGLEEGVTYQIYLKSLPFPVYLIWQFFINEDGSRGELYLITSDPNVDYETIKTTYQRRWRVEQYHKSLKQNTALGKSPTRKMRTQSNHFFAAIYAFFKLECLAVSEEINQFAFRSKLYLSALKASFKELQQLQLRNAA